MAYYEIFCVDKSYGDYNPPSYKVLKKSEKTLKEIEDETFREMSHCEYCTAKEVTETYYNNEIQWRQYIASCGGLH